MRIPEIKPHKKYRYDEIMESLARSARLYGVKLLAAQMGADEGYLQSKLTVTSSSSAHYLRADEMISIMLITGDQTPLYMIAELFDMTLAPREVDNSSENRLSVSLDIMSETANYHGWLAEALKDKEITEAEWSTGQEILKLLERKAAAASKI